MLAYGIAHSEHLLGIVSIHAIASSTLVLIKESGHVQWIEQPVAFDAACEQWFQEHYAS